MADGLLEEIGREGDALWARTLPCRSKGRPLPLDATAPPDWSLCFRMMAWLEDANEPIWLWLLTLMVIIPFFVFDFLHAIFRLFLWPIVLLLWCLERQLALWNSRAYFCPICHHEMEDPWVYCDNPNCKQPVQPRLRPQYNSLFRRRCPSCRRRSWAVLGQRLLWPATTFVCRDTRTSSGCSHPLGILDLAGRLDVRHLALTGTSSRARHAVMAQLFCQLVEGDGAAYEPGWNVSALELDLCREVLGQALNMDTEFCDRPGEHYTLAWTFLLRSVRRQRALCFHHLIGAWLERTESLAEQGTNWKALDGLILVLDPDDLVLGTPPNVLPAEEVYSRLLRVTEEFCALTPGVRLPYRVALVLGVPQRCEALERIFIAGGEGAEEKVVEETLREYAPGLLALVRRTAGKVRCFGGSIPEEVDTEMTGWLRQAAEWAAG